MQPSSSGVQCCDGHLGPWGQRMVSDLGQSVAVGPVWGQRREALRGCFLSRPHAPPHLLPTTSANEEQMKEEQILLDMRPICPLLIWSTIIIHIRTMPIV